MFSSTADWYLAAVVGTDPSYDPAVAGLSRRHGERVIDAGGRAGQRCGGLPELARILTLSGIAMGVAGSTAPSSGMEHAISHLLEMTDTAAGGTQLARHEGRRRQHRRRRHLGACPAQDRRGGAGPAGRIPDADQARERISAAFSGIDGDGAMAAECFADYARKLAVLAAGADPLAGLRDAGRAHDAALGEMLTGPAELASALASAGLPARFSRPAGPGGRRRGALGGGQLRAAAPPVRRRGPGHAARLLDGRRHRPGPRRCRGSVRAG